MIALGVSIYIKKLEIYGHTLLNSSRELTATLQENLSGIEVIKSFAKEHRQSEKLKGKIENHAKNHLNLTFGNYMVHILTEALGVIAIAVLFLVAIKTSDMDYKIVLTQLLPFIYILARMLPLIKLINQARGVIVSRWPGFDAVYDLLRLDNKPLIKDGNKNYAGIKNAIHFNSVTFSSSAPKAILFLTVSLKINVS